MSDPDDREQARATVDGSFPQWPFLDTGAVFHGYRIEGLLGVQTSAGFTYEATHLARRSRVALKLLPGYLSRDPAFRERFKRDVRAQSAIDHPHLPTVHDAGESGFDLFLVMSLLRGDTLKELIDGEHLDPRRALRILGPIADALDLAHDHGLLHSAIKPKSIVVGRNDHAVLTDFGLTQVGLRKLVDAGEFAGTLAYSAPEEVHGEGPSRQGDIYALAAVLHECLTGEPPPAAPAIELHSRGFTAALEGMMRRGLAPDPAARPRSARELMREAEEAIVGPSVANSRTERAARRQTEKAARQAERTAQQVTERGATQDAEHSAEQKSDREAKRAELRARQKAEREAKRVERKAKLEAEREAREESERKAQLEAERDAARKAERRAWEESERRAKQEAERKAKQEAERKALEESERKAKQKAKREAERKARQKAKLEAEREAREESERKPRLEAERDAERRAWEVSERKAKQEAERKAKREAERKAKRQADEQAAGVTPRRKAEPQPAPERDKEPPDEKAPARTGPGAKRQSRLRRAFVGAAVVAAAVGGGFVAGNGGSTAPHPKGGKSAPGTRPSAADAAALDAAIAKLDAARTAGRGRLANARTPGEQTARATELARAYQAAIQGLRTRSGTGSGAANAAVVAALDRTQRAYRDLASSARRGDGPGYDRGRAAVARGEQLLTGALASLRR